MTPEQRNNGRPMPWHDTATCEDPECQGPMVPVEEMANGYGGPVGSRIACSACGEGRVGTEDDVQKTRRAALAWDMHEAGLVHPDRVCARCNGALPLDRVRLCAPCVERDGRERQVNLFPGVR